MIAARLLLALLLVVLASIPARAASEREMSLEEMVGAADEVVVGEVVTTSARWEGRLIVTDAVVRVDEALKGAPTKTLTITELGGTAVHPVLGAPVTMDVSGECAPRAARASRPLRRAAPPRTPRPGRRLTGQGRPACRRTRARPRYPSGRSDSASNATGPGHDRAESTTLDALRERIRAIVGAPLR